MYGFGKYLFFTLCLALFRSITISTLKFQKEKLICGFFHAINMVWKNYKSNIQSLYYILASISSVNKTFIVLQEFQMKNQKSFSMSFRKFENMMEGKICAILLSI